MRPIYLVLLLTLLSSCNGGKAPPVKVEVETIATPTPAIVATPSPSASPVAGRVRFKPVEYYTTSEQRKLIASVEDKANEVKNSDCVYDFLSKRKMIQTDGKTNEQVAKEVRAISGEIPVEFYYPRWPTKAVAYREPPSLTIHLNGKVYGTWSSVCDLVSVLLHESIGHSLLNYDHDFNWSPSREYSVPYSINHAVDTGSYSGSPSGACCK